MRFKATAPGSLMLLGEHAVLSGKPALVAAINKCIHVHLTPRSDREITLTTEKLGNLATNIKALRIAKPFQFVLAVLVAYRPHFPCGFDLEIRADFSDQIGLGSSAAVTVATLAVITQWLKIKLTPLAMIKQARKIVRQIQGVGSGADIAASVLGGLVSFQAQPLKAKKILAKLPLTVLYAGYKTPTVQVIKQVEKKFCEQPLLLRRLKSNIGLCAEIGIKAASRKQWKKLGEMMSIQQGLMQSLGVSTPLLNSMVDNLLQSPTMLGAKISGSGLGDCVVGLGDQFDLAAHLRLTQSGVQEIKVQVIQQGVHCEKI